MLFGAALTDDRIVSVLMLTPIVVTVTYDPVADLAPVAQVANFQFARSVNTAIRRRSIGVTATEGDSSTTF